MHMRKLFLAALALVAFMGAPAMAEEGHHGMPEGHGKMMKNEADTNDDGMLSKAEFMAMQEKRFAEMDANSDGNVTKEEMKAHVGKMKEKFEERRKEMKEKMEENGKKAE